jgi:hypothetical protein
MAVGSSAAIATSLQMQSKDHAPSEIFEVAKAMEVDCRLTTPQQQGLGTKRPRATVTKHTTATSKQEATTKTNRLTSTAAAATAAAAAAAGVAAETAAQEALESPPVRFWVRKHQYRADVESNIDGFDLPELGGSYGNWRRVLGGMNIKLEEQSKRQHLRQMVRQCREKNMWQLEW